MSVYTHTHTHLAPLRHWPKHPSTVASAGRPNMLRPGTWPQQNSIVVMTAAAQRTGEITKISYFQEVLPKPMSRARQQVRQQRRAVWVGLNLELIKIIARRGWVCKYCPHQRWDTRNSCRPLNSHFKDHLPSAPFLLSLRSSFGFLRVE